MNDVVTPPSSAADALSPPAPPPAPAFFESFKDDGLKQWAGANKFESPEAVAALAHKFDAFKDADPASLAALPKADDFNAKVEFLRERLGAPKEATAYELDKIEGVDPKLAASAAEWFKDAGILPEQARLIAQKQMEHIAAEQAEIAKEEKAAGEREIAALNYDTASMEIAKRGKRLAEQKLGITAADLQYLESGVGAGKVVALFNLLGSYTKESDFVVGDSKQPQADNPLARQYPNEFQRDQQRASRG